LGPWNRHGRETLVQRAGRYLDSPYDPA
jgi:hypothetical protein